MSTPTTIEITTERCMFCGDNSVMTVNAASYVAWKDGALIQDAFPEFDAATREVIKTGTHGKCWEQMFGIPDTL
jgi:hypothetical protein